MLVGVHLPCPDRRLVDEALSSRAAERDYDEDRGEDDVASLQDYTSAAPDSAWREHRERVLEALDELDRAAGIVQVSPAAEVGKELEVAGEVASAAACRAAS